MQGLHHSTSPSPNQIGEKCSWLSFSKSISMSLSTPSSLWPSPSSPFSTPGSFALCLTWSVSWPCNPPSSPSQGVFYCMKDNNFWEWLMCVLEEESSLSNEGISCQIVLRSSKRGKVQCISAVKIIRDNWVIIRDIPSILASGPPGNMPLSVFLRDIKASWYFCFNLMAKSS